MDAFAGKRADKLRAKGNRPAEQALKLQRPLDGLRIVARGMKEDKV